MKIIDILEVRGHARGGQGMVTAFEILAKIFSYCKNYEVQAFPFFGVERTGAPIQAFLRISPNPILNRSNIYNPGMVVVFDEGLIESTAVFDGLAERGIILINTTNQPSFYKGRAKNIYTVPATKISVDLKLGSKSLPIVNAAMIGAILKILDADIKTAQEIIRKEVPAKPEANSEAAEIAYGCVNFWKDESYKINDSKIKPVAVPSNHLPVVPYWEKPMSMNKTGNWRVLEPNYLTRQPPCTDNCPAGTDVRKFVNLVSNKKYKEAYEVIYNNNPFPSICGRVCPHFCQQNCNRNVLDEQLNIGGIERFIGDINEEYRFESVPLKYDERIAVIGSGPAGLTAALRMRRMGYAVTVFESAPSAGGMMRTGIPEFRLPENILNNEIEKITEQGIEIILNTKVSVDDVAEDFSAVVVAVGSHIGRQMNVSGENDSIEGIEFLRDIKLNKNQSKITRGDRVAIFGGGNTAIDVARTVLRLGGTPTIYYRRTRHEMPAIAHEVEEALKEGVKIEFLKAPVQMKKSISGLFQLTLVDMKLGKADNSGRKRPIVMEGTERTLEFNKVIKATGQTFDDFVFQNEKIIVKQGELEFVPGNIKIPIFCSGDMAWGGTVVEAIGSGNEVADEVNACLRNIKFQKKIINNDVVSSDQINYNYYLPIPSQPNRFKEIINLYNDFSEVVKGLKEKEVVAESNRCLHCGDCFKCGNCFNYCPDAAISIDEENRMRIDYDYCKGCGICVNECPSSAIRFGEELVVKERDKLFIKNRLN